MKTLHDNSWKLLEACRRGIDYFKHGADRDSVIKSLERAIELVEPK